ncbi:MAG: folate-binding protein YgfZ [Burkholderiaceae bacterium]|nr:folate-binding protein YgfZ [Burkholderiaceae bacterium]
MQANISEELNWNYSLEPNYRLLLVKGEDSERFLQGQLTQDVVKLPQNKAQWCSACNYQGRVASSSLILRTLNGFALLLPSSIAELEMNRLKRYILRSKVTMEISDLSICYARLPLTDIKADYPNLPSDDMQVYVDESCILVRLPCLPADEDAIRCLIIKKDNADVSRVSTSNQLSRDLLLQGIALIEASETLKWLPQALNLDLIGAVARNKGCYTGQEVINKTQTLARIKRRMFLGEIDSPVVNQSEIMCDGTPVGNVVLSNQQRFLYVLDWEFENKTLTLNDQIIQNIPLPYLVNIPKSAI